MFALIVISGYLSYKENLKFSNLKNKLTELLMNHYLSGTNNIYFFISLVLKIDDRKTNFTNVVFGNIFRKTV